MEDHASEHSYQQESQTPFTEKAIIERLDIRCDLLVIKLEELRQEHTSCESAMCKHDVVACDTKNRIYHAQQLAQGLNALLESDNTAAKVMCELTWEALEQDGKPIVITMKDMFKEATPTKENSEKYKQRNKQHTLTLALRLFMKGKYQEASNFVYESGIQLPAGYEMKIKTVLPRKTQSLRPAIESLQ